MSTATKSFLATWAPLIFSVAANLALAGYVYGRTESRISVLEEHRNATTREKLVSFLVTRAEFDQRVQMRDKEAVQNREDHKMIMEKLDRLIERSK